MKKELQREEQKYYKISQKFSKSSGKIEDIIEEKDVDKKDKN